MVRFILVDLPITHRELIRMQEDLHSVGFDISLLDIINCSLRMHGILDTLIARKWMQDTHPSDKLQYDVEKLSRLADNLFSGFMIGLKINCKAIAYENGEAIVEMSYDVKWNELNCFEYK